jgi:calpain-7
LQLKTAATKDEALTLAIGAAENLMKALKLSSSPDEKKQLKAQCGEIMNVADRIKNTETWEPEVKPQPPSSRNERTGQWVAEVAVTAYSVDAFEDLTSQSGSSRYGLSSTTAPVDHVHATIGKSSASSMSAFIQRTGVFPTYSPKSPAPETPALLIDLSDDLPSFDKASAPTDASHEDSPQPKRDYKIDNRNVPAPVVRTAVPQESTPIVEPKLPTAQTAALSLSVAPYSQIRRLPEPVSSRKLPPKESIILLKASMVNGFKFPPWDKTPSTDEFRSQEGVDLFT